MRSILLLTPLLALPTLFACHGPRRLPEPQPPTSRPAGFLFREHEHDGRTYRYAVYVPRELPENPPVVLFLHGRGESGTDGSRQIAVGIGRELLWNPDRWPAIVLLPQKPDHESQWPEHEPAVLGILDAAIDEFGADPRRVVLTGLSQGGHGSWIIASRTPGRFARVAPVCGYVRFPFRGEDLPHAAPDQPEFRGLAGGLAGTPVWAFHGSADPIVPADETTAAAEALERAGNDRVRVTIYDGVGHAAWEPAYADPALARWLLAPDDD